LRCSKCRKSRSRLNRNGDPWFVGKDVVAALGYNNTKDALGTHVDDEDKIIV